MEPDDKQQPERYSQLKFSIVTLLVMMLFSCENDLAVVEELSKKDTLPLVTSYNVEVYYSEMGLPQFTLQAPVVSTYAGDDSYQEFPEGFHVIFFDSLMQIRSELMANYGLSNEKQKIMEARNNVIVLNHEKNEKMNTEHMIWDRNQKLIFSDMFVKITTPGDVIYGENGFEADESFNNWVIRKTSGEIQLDKDQ